MDTDARIFERDRPPPRPTRWRGWSRSVRAGVALAAFVMALALFSMFVAQPYAIPTGSMENTLRPGDRVLVNKLAYRFGNHPERGDVVVFDGTGSFTEEASDSDPLAELLRSAGAAVGLASPAGSDYVKRVVGTGGDRIKCCDARGRLEVNGESLAEPYVNPGGQRASGARGTEAAGLEGEVPFDTVVPEGRLWLMGDHRSASEDSRHFLGHPGGGAVRVDEVIGRVERVIWPLSRWTPVGTSRG